MPPDDDWASATDLAEYSYCPRSLYYRRTAPDAPDTRAAARGRRDHAHALAAERRRAGSSAVYWAALLAGVTLVLAAAVLLHP